jgi:hypothetical protein
MEFLENSCIQTIQFRGERSEGHPHSSREQ